MKIVIGGGAGGYSVSVGGRPMAFGLRSLSAAYRTVRENIPPYTRLKWTGNPFLAGGLVCLVKDAS